MSPDHPPPPGYNSRKPSERVHVEKTDVRSALRGKEAFSLHDVMIHIKVPYDPEINQILKDIRAKWNKTRKIWMLPVGRFAQLSPHIQRINDLARADWHDRVNTGLRDHLAERRVHVPEPQISQFPEGGMVFRDGAEWTVTYVGRKRLMDDGSVTYPVYLSRPASGVLVDNAEDGFHPSQDRG